MLAFTSIPPFILESLSETSRTCLERLSKNDLDKPDLSDHPHSRLAAVLILLYESAGKMRVLLTTRSKALRTHAGQTALPGGKVDNSDKDFVETAYREAFEEVALPLNCPDIYTIALLEPFLSAHRILVTPVVAFLTDPTILHNLKAADGEVSAIFNHPLEALLDPTIALNEPLVQHGSEHWPYDTDLINPSDVTVETLGNSSYRMHRFRSTASPIKGLTADILIKTAEIAYGKAPAYDRYAPGQEHGYAAICRILVRCGAGNLPRRDPDAEP